MIDSSQVSSEIVTEVCHPIMTKMKKLLSLYTEHETKKNQHSLSIIFVWKLTFSDLLCWILTYIDEI